MLTVGIGNGIHYLEKGNNHDIVRKKAEEGKKKIGAAFPKNNNSPSMSILVPIMKSPGAISNHRTLWWADVPPKFLRRTSGAPQTTFGRATDAPNHLDATIVFDFKPL